MFVNRISWREFILRIAPVILIVAAIILFFYKMVFSNLILARGDTFLYFYPYWHAAAEALQAARLPLWNNQLFMGSPFLANSQAGLLYIFNWPFWLALAPPYAVKASVVLHISIAGIGAYLAGRRCFSLSRISGLVSALLFALGGYLTSQVEHVNQLQGLAWIPWYFYVACLWQGSKTNRRATARFIASIGILTALQLLAGHTQTVFISLSGLVIWMAACSLQPGGRKLRTFLNALLILSAGILLAMLLSGMQLVPAIELVLHSSRQGGLAPREALSFSLHPLVLTRSLLPSYETPIFSEYVAFLPLGALLLALFGAWDRWVKPEIKALVLVTAVGFLFALGFFNPLYQLLIRLPLFDLFRVPARWLVLYAFGIAMLSGAGLDALVSSKDRGNTRRIIVIGILIMLALAIWGVAAEILAAFVEVGSEVVVEKPAILTWVGWAAELAAFLLLIFLLPRFRGILSRAVIVGLLLLTLFAASRDLPYNSLTTPEAYSDLRPPNSRLQAIYRCSDLSRGCENPGGRVLSLSDIFFDPGDQAEIDSVYGDSLSDESLYDYTVAIKQKEILAPNLVMVYGLQSIDGFDGGLLPLENYQELTKLLLPDDRIATDGRLREYLDSIPEDRWLDLFGATYLITDKVGDEWRNGVFFDRQFPETIDKASPTIGAGYLPEFEATEIWMISESGSGRIEVTTSDGDKWTLQPKYQDGDLLMVEFPEPAVLTSLILRQCDSTKAESDLCETPWSVGAISLVDNRDGTFRQLALGDYRLIHSGDVKVYENLDALPPAFLVGVWENQPDVESSIVAMEDAQFDPAKKAVVVGVEGGSVTGFSEGRNTVSEYLGEKIRLLVQSEQGGLLVLTEAFYPGWKAWIDEIETDIFLTDGYFRGIMIPPGSHTVDFAFEPDSLQVGIAFSSVGFFFLLFLLVEGLSIREKIGQMRERRRVNQVQSATEDVSDNR